MGQAECAGKRRFGKIAIGLLPRQHFAPRVIWCFPGV
jgi:hypothetical protein